MSQKVCAAIVGLVKGHDRIDNYSNLIRRNRLIHRNFNKKYGYPIIIFHEGNIVVEHQRLLSSLTPNVSFVDVSGKAFVTPENVPVEWRDRLGYKHMCRFYAMQIYDFVQPYDYIMLLDDDSFLESPIEYDLFEFMRSRNLDYGYVYSELDYHAPTVATLPAFTRQYIQENDVQVNCSLEAIDALYFYTNFFLTRVAFWKEPGVVRFLETIDQSLGIYQYRWGDGVIQTHTLKMFSQQTKWHHFQDFRYSHGSHEWSNYRKSKLPAMLAYKFRHVIRRINRYYLTFLMRRIQSA